MRHISLCSWSASRYSSPRLLRSPAHPRAAGQLCRSQTPRTLLIDNYDSFTYNLYQLLAVQNGACPTVIRNDQLPWNELHQYIESGSFDNVVLSPGPGSPEHASDVGLCRDLLQAKLQIPILGVCLGLQALAQVFGGKIVPAPEAVHGRLSSIEHANHPLFAGIPSGEEYRVVRYHSLVVDADTLPACLEEIAWTAGSSSAVGCPATPDKGVATRRLLMGVAHDQLPYYGVQFHPESVATALGAKLLLNFQRLCQEFWAQQGARREAGHTPQFTTGQRPSDPPRHHNIALCSPAIGVPQGIGLDVRWQRLPGILPHVGGSERVFWDLFGMQDASDAFWLDSAAPDRGRFSFMGASGGPLWQRITYRLPAAGQPGSEHPARHAQRGRVDVEDSSGSVTCEPLHATFWDYLEGRLGRYHVNAAGCSDLPFDFHGGFVGYLGYELKAETCGSHAFQSPHPDANLFLVDRFVAFDHRDGDVYLVALAEAHDPDSCAAADGWLAATADRVAAMQPGSAQSTTQRSLQWQHSAAASREAPGVRSHVVPHPRPSAHPRGSPGQPDPARAAAAVSSPGARAEGPDSVLVAAASSAGCSAQQGACPSQAAPDSMATGPAQPARQLAPAAAADPLEAAAQPFRLRRSRRQYQRDVEACLEELRAGNSYELCLTSAIECTGTAGMDPRVMYSHLRHVNPAPHAAFLRFGGPAPLTVCCSSPERFLQCGRDEGAGSVLTARPIKGTRGRAADPAEDAAAAAALAGSEKDRAENLMIVDLLRNDLGQVCEVGSVTVPGLMEIESFATVHQMVSTVQGMRRKDKSAIDCIRAAFPGGSMTGAPKKRSMEILDRLERGPRGIYSGSIGYISFNGAFDLNIVIRTAVFASEGISVGAGGAVVMQSQPETEYQEMRLKARSVLHAIALSAGLAGRSLVEEA